MIRQRNQDAIDPNMFLASILSTAIVWCIGTAFAQLLTGAIEYNVEKKYSSR
jgi:hypothetical protein